MKLLNKFTIQNLRLNKKRTIVTIIGIMLSSALICGLVGLVSSFQQTFINMAKDTVGNYHTRFYGMPKEKLKYIENNLRIDNYFYTSQIGIGILEESKNNAKPYISVLEYNDTALKNNGIKLIEGSLPQNDKELVIAQHINTNARMNFKLSDKVTLNLGKRVSDDGSILTQNNPYISEDEENKNAEQIIDIMPREYTIVGIMERPDYSVEKYSSPSYTAITHMEKIPENIDVSVLYENPKEYEENNKMILGEEEYDTYINRELLRYQGAMSNSTLKVLYGIATVVMIIIVCSSVFVIRNSFSISVAEKNKQYGMLSSIGATKRQIKRTVVFEGFIIGLIAIPLGIVCGIIAIIILLQVVNYLLEDSLMGMKFVYTLPPLPIFISVLISFLTIYLSCILPARRAAKISPIEAIRGNNDIKINKNKIKTSKCTKKLFGIGGVIASKNLKRSRRKYITTVISIVISIVIFVSLSSFLYYGNKTSDVYYTEVNYNMVLSTSGDDTQKLEDYKKVIKLDNIEKYSYYKEIIVPINPKYLSEFGKKIMSRYTDEELTDEFIRKNSNINIILYNDNYYKEYAKSLGIKEGEYNSGGILIDENIFYRNDEQKDIKKTYNLNSGDDASLTIEGKGDINVKILINTDKRPMGLENIYKNGGMLIMSENYFENIQDTVLSELYINSNDATKLENTINDLAKLDSAYKDMSIINYEKMADIENRMVLVISIFLYGFITVITLIGVTNIFNTITTNMILRSKEFAMLKSIGMTTKEFNKMIKLESMLYGLKSLIIGLPLGIVGSYFIYSSFAESIDTGYTLPIDAILISVVFVFIIVGATMKYALSKINKQNIIDTIRNDNI